MFSWLREFLDLRIEYKTKKLNLEAQKINVDTIKVQSSYEHERDITICQSCETLKMQLAIANQEKKDLLNRILKEPEVKTQTVIQNPRAVIPSRHLGFDARRRALETESRANARLIEEKRKEDSKLKVVTAVDENTKTVEVTDVDDLEKELDIAAAERESQSAN